MTKATKAQKKADNPTAKIESYQEKSKPLTALFLVLFGLLVFVALFDYEWGQSHQSTTHPVSENVVGAFGAEASYLLYHWLGLGAWIVPLLLYWLSFLFATARARRIFRLKSIGYPLIFLGITGLLTIVNDASQKDETMPVLSTCHLGLGGQLGNIVYGESLQKWLGAFGSVVLFAFIMIACFFAIATNDITVAFDNWRNKLGLITANFADNIRESKKKFLQDIVEKRALKKELKELAKQKKQKERDSLKKDREEAKNKKGEILEMDSAANSEEELLSKTFNVKSDSVNELDKKQEIELEDTETSKPSIQEVDASRKEKEQPQPFSIENAPQFKIVEAETVDKVALTVPLSRGDYEFPSMDLLGEAPEFKSVPQEEIEDTAQRLQQTLAEFKIKVDLGEVHTGPVITRYDIYPAPGVKVEKIAGLDKNLAMSMRAEAVRVLAPVPGKGCVGVEVPNRKPLPVCMREIIESKAWANAKEGLPLILGKDVSGKPLVADLTKMPHLLIAGSTGSGKSVCLNSIIASMCYFGSPEDVRFIMVDPKIVEMQAYNSLPHMLIPVVTNPKKVPGALKWLISEMDRRYQIFKNAGVRNIAGFNEKVLNNNDEKQQSEALDSVLSPEERAAVNASLNSNSGNDEEFSLPENKLPYIVCIIDELADLMMVAPADIETSIARIAQLARAAGIHLILATQRPSVNVITGVIKANLPSRIAFKVASYRDSMTILDCKGAETLIGKGDMLFIPPGASTLVRAQGAFLSDAEINDIVEFLKRNGPPEYVEEVQRQVEASGEDEEDLAGVDESDLDDDEILLRKVLQVMKASRKASTSMFQRRLKIGYNRAGRIMDMLEDRGYVGPDNGSQPREILIDLDSL